MKTASFGSISSGTMRTEDLIDALTDELESLIEGDEHKALIAEADAWLASAGTGDAENGAEIVEELFEALNEFAPPYGYFGAHPGDGADYGFWLYDDFIDAFDGLQVDDTSEVPADYCGEVLHVNDHGNMTLYVKDEGSNELREIWSLV